MPPKVDSAGEGASATPVKDTPAKTGKADSSEGDFKLAWAIICQMAKQGKLAGIDWDEVKDQVGKNTAKTTQNAYYAMRERMVEKGCPLPSAEPKDGKAATPKTPKKTPKNTPKKRKEGEGRAVTPEGADGEGDDDAPATPTPAKKQRKAKTDGDTPKKPRKTAKQAKAETEAGAAFSSQENVEGGLEGADGTTSHVKANMEIEA